MQTSASVRAGGAYRKGVPLMALEILGALAALAAIGSFLLDAALAIRDYRERKNTRRMAREEETRSTSENK